MIITKRNVSMITFVSCSTIEIRYQLELLIFVIVICVLFTKLCSN